MKKNLTLKLLASAAIIATAAPIISLASCSKKSNTIDIDPSEKTKQLNKGDREVVYTIKVDSLGSDQTLNASVVEPSSTQTGYTVKVTKPVEFDSETSTAAVTVGIVSSNNELIKDGTEFEFSLVVEKLNSQGKTLASNRFDGFKLVYGVPTTQGLILQGNARTYTNPAQGTHTYLYTPSLSMEIDKDCEFECDVVKTYEGSTVDVDIKCESVKYEEDTNSLLVKFLIFRKAGELKEGDVVNFSYTLSCKKDGKELWRQQFKDYQIEYLYHVMWIAKDYQDTLTYAGEKKFNLYILKNDFLTPEMLDANSIKFEITDPANAGVTFSWDKNTVTSKQYLVEQTYLTYFEVPVTIDGISTEVDTPIKYNTTLEGYIGGERITKTFSDLSIKYVAGKIATEPATKQVYLNNVKQHEFDFTLNNALEYGQTLTCEFVKTSGESSKTTGSTTINVTGTDVKVNVTVNTDQLVDKIGFTLKLVCKNATGVVWEQNSTGYEITTYVSAEVKEPHITVKNEDPSQAVSGMIEIDLCGEINTDVSALTKGQIWIDDNITAVSDKAESHIEKATYILKHSESGMPKNKLYINVTLYPEQNGVLSDESKTNFSFTVGGKIKVDNDSAPQEWTKTFTNLEVRYDVGKMKWEDGWYIKECITDRFGKTYSDTIETEFSLTSALAQGQKLEAKTEVASGSSSGYVVELVNQITVDGTKVLVPMRLARSNESQKIYFGDHVYYNITITCKDADNHTVWEQKISDCYIYALAKFDIKDTEKTKKSKIPTNFDVSHSVSIPTTRLGFKFETYIDNIVRGAGVPETVSVEPSESLKVRDENHSTQVVRWTSTTGMKDNQYVTFDMHIKVTFTEYLYDPVSYTFDITGLKIIFATEE